MMVCMQILGYIGSPSQWFILAVVCLVVFGASRLPDLARNLGKSLGILHKAKREFEEELLKAQNPTPPPSPAADAEVPEELKAQAQAEQQASQAADKSPQA